MDKQAHREAWLKVLAEKGWDGVLAELEQATGFGLYQVSTDWAKSAEFILKAKGARGDVLVTWVA